MHKHYDLIKYFFVNRIITLWNSLPQDIVSAHSVHIFKNKLDMHWLNIECKFDWKADILETGT
jgi:hypothetical protein